MSAINSNSDDRDLEAIRCAQRAHEPSMEEILASIRSIIADEREPAQSAAPQTGAAKAHRGGGRTANCLLQGRRHVATRRIRAVASRGIPVGERRDLAKSRLAPAGTSRFRIPRRCGPAQ
jgi:hypothetical protein